MLVWHWNASTLPNRSRELLQPVGCRESDNGLVYEVATCSGCKADCQHNFYAKIRTNVIPSKRLLDPK